MAEFVVMANQNVYGLICPYVVRGVRERSPECKWMALVRAVRGVTSDRAGLGEGCESRMKCRGGCGELSG